MPESHNFEHLPLLMRHRAQPAYTEAGNRPRRPLPIGNRARITALRLRRHPTAPPKTTSNFATSVTSWGSRFYLLAFRCFCR
jgi:hypothetical protein